MAPRGPRPYHLLTRLLTRAATDRERPACDNTRMEDRPLTFIVRLVAGEPRTPGSGGASENGTQGRDPQSRGRRARDRERPRKGERHDAQGKARAGDGWLARN